MKSDTRPKTLQDLATAYKQGDLRVNPEYQRGTKWQKSQRQSLIDSILRGFSLPLFYVHVESTMNTFGNTPREKYWIVDGQQRLAAISDFLSDQYALADPRNITAGAVLPYLRDELSAWAGKKFSELSAEDRERFLKHELMVVCMHEEQPNEVRDLFIRLQSGTPLTAQEKRDAWPGNFSQFIIQHAGKPNHSRSNPHSFFDLIKNSGPTKISVDDEDHYIDKRANTRKFFAGLAMTLIIRETTDQDFVDLKGKNINDFYLRYAGLDPASPEAQRVVKVLDTIYGLPDVDRLSRRGNQLSYQLALHFALVVDTFLQGDYVPGSWRIGLVEAFEAFRAKEAEARARHKDERVELPHYRHFVRKLSGSGSDTAGLIRQRHFFLLSEILAIVQPKPRDPKRLFGRVEREAIWYRDGGKCQHPDCGAVIPFAAAQIHHVREHTTGGRTVMDNGILVCATCHADRAGMQAKEAFFVEQIAKRNGAIDDEAEAVNGEDQAPVGNLKVEIDWRAIGVERLPQVLQEANDSTTVVKFCEVLLATFGADMEANLTSIPVVRYPLSANPEIDFINQNTGRPYTHAQIPGTELYVCTQSDGNQKVRRLAELAEALFPGSHQAIRVSREPASAETIV